MDIYYYIPISTLREIKVQDTIAHHSFEKLEVEILNGGSTVINWPAEGKKTHFVKGFVMNVKIHIPYL